jgi:3',5'-cyclic-AMP phosphodiesterase
MPGLFFEPLDRRRFLTATALGATALSITGCHSASKHAGNDNLHVALISDTHIPADKSNEYRGFKPWENLEKIVPEIANARPEGVIHCGDVARVEGLAGDYQEVRSLLQPVAAFAPIYIGLGNHDHRANFSATFPAMQHLRANVADKHVLVLDEGFVRILLLDSLLYTNKTAGLLGKKQRSWLSEFLATNSDKPIVIFVHHTLGDEDGELMDARRLFEMVEPHKQVKAIFYGHSHVWEFKRQDRLHLINLPAVGYNFKDADPVGWVDARFDPNGVSLTLRVLAGKHADDKRVRRLDWV